MDKINTLAEVLNKQKYDETDFLIHFTVNNEYEDRSHLIIDFNRHIYFKVLTIYNDGHFLFDNGITYLNTQSQQIVVNYLAE